jgi:hypothetical protein
VRRPEAHAALGHPRRTGRAHRQGDAEVRHQRLAFVQQDVLRLDLAMDHAVAVGVVERARHLTGNPHGVPDRELLLMVEPVAQRLPFHKRHDVVEQSVGFSRVDETEDVGVLEMRGDLDLFQEPIGADDSGQLEAQHLEGDGAVVAQVVREVDRGHAAAAEFALDRVATCEGGAQAVDECLQRAHGDERAVFRIRARDAWGQN